MTTSTTSRATVKAGAMQAGQPIADGSLPDLLDFDSVAEGVRVGDLLRERLASAEAAVAAHAAGFENAQLAGDAAERTHADAAARLGREVARLRLAIERADTRLAEVADAERKVAARAKVKAARADAERAEEIVATLYPAAARAVVALLGELTELHSSIRAARADAAEAGIGDEAAALVLPHETRSRSEIAETVEVEEVEARPSVTDAHGNPVGGAGGRQWGGQAQPAPTMIRRSERRIVQARFTAPDLTTARAVLPDPEGGRLLDRGEG